MTKQLNLCLHQDGQLTLTPSPARCSSSAFLTTCWGSSWKLAFSMMEASFCSSQNSLSNLSLCRSFLDMVMVSLSGFNGSNKDYISKRKEKTLYVNINLKSSQCYTKKLASKCVKAYFVFEKHTNFSHDNLNKVSFIILRHFCMHWPCWLRTWGRESSLTKRW